MKRLFLSGMAMCALLTSCYSEIDSGELMPEPRPVVNAIASPDTVVIASISRTYSIDENVDDLFIKNADVLLTVNGSHHEQMTMVEYNDTTDRYEPQQVVAYVSTYRPQPGDRIEIDFDMTCRVINAPLGSNRAGDNFQAVVRGPIVLARDENIDPNFDQPVAIQADENGVVAITPVQPTLPSTKMEFLVPTSEGDIHMVDYASVDGWNGSKICTWLPILKK